MRDFFYDIDKQFPELDQNTRERINEFVQKRVYDSVEPIEIDPRNVYVASIDTGMMPKPKAEKYLKDWLRLYNEAVEKTGEEKGNMIAMPYSHASQAIEFFKLSKNKATIIYYDGGVMADEKLDKVTEVYNKCQEDLTAKGYEVKFIRKHPGEIIVGIAE